LGNKAGSTAKLSSLILLRRMFDNIASLEMFLEMTVEEEGSHVFACSLSDDCSPQSAAPRPLSFKPTQ
jgi:hypothetical protein